MPPELVSGISVDLQGITKRDITAVSVASPASGTPPAMPSGGTFSAAPFSEYAAARRLGTFAGHGLRITIRNNACKNAQSSLRKILRQVTVPGTQIIPGTVAS